MLLRHFNIAHGSEVMIRPAREKGSQLLEAAGGLFFWAQNRRLPLNDDVTPENGWMIVIECDHPFSLSDSPIVIPDQVLANSRYQWHRVVASSHANYKKGDLVCLLCDTNIQDKLFMDGMMLYGSIHSSAVRHKIPADKATHIKDKLFTADMAMAAMAKAKKVEDEASQAAQRMRTAMALQQPNGGIRRLVN